MTGSQWLADWQDAAEARRALLPVGWEEDNRMHARMLDGRTVHFYLQFVEPEWRVLATTASQSLFACLNSRSDAALNMTKAADTGLPVGRDEYAQGMTLIRSMGLGYFSELCGETEEALAATPRRRPQNEVDAAHNLLRRDAAEFFKRWLITEAVTRGCTPDPVRHGRLSTLFCSSVVREFDTRLGESRMTRRSRAPITGRLNLLPTLARAEPLQLSAELVACWYPNWRRAAWIMDSPFNAAPSLGSLE